MFAIAAVQVFDNETGQGIEGAIVDVFSPGGTIPLISGVTDGNGYVEINVLGMTYDFKALHRNYETLTVTATMEQDVKNYIPMYLVQSISNKKALKIYCVENRNYRVVGTRVMVANELRRTNKDGLVQFYVLPGTYLVQFLNSGIIYISPVQFENIEYRPYIAQIQVSEDTVVTAFVQQGTTRYGDPPSPPNGDGQNIGKYIAVGVVAVLSVWLLGQYLGAPKIVIGRMS